MSEPKSSDILRALRAHVAVRAHSMRRMKTGLAHYVYEIMTDGTPVVVRMADRSHWNGIPGGVYWHPRLTAIGVPLPQLFGFDLEAEFPYMVLERLPGRDLAFEYDNLSVSQKETLADEIVAIQARVAALTPAKAYGWLDSYEVSGEHYPDWPTTLESGLREAQKFISDIGVFDPGIVDQVRAAAEPYQRYFEDVPPAPFLDDTTTKNVLIRQGKLTGIVDVDHVCFGDRLYVLSLTKMALLSQGSDTDYIEMWGKRWQLTEFQNEIVDIYTAMHGVYFMSEIGRQLNKDSPEPAEPAQISRLNRILTNLLKESD